MGAPDATLGNSWGGAEGGSRAVEVVGPTHYNLRTMRALKAHVRGGRLVFDEPTNLPEGAEVRVALVDGDELDDRERAELHAAILAAEAELDAGQVVSEDDLWARLRPAQ